MHAIWDGDKKTFKGDGAPHIKMRWKLSLENKKSICILSGSNRKQ